MKKIFLIALAVALVGCSPAENPSEVEAEFEIIEVLEQSCELDADCETPFKYAILSNCPHSAKCIGGKCSVICPNLPVEVKISIDAPEIDPDSLAPIAIDENFPVRAAAIREYLLSQNEFSWTTEAGSVRECAFADLNPEKELFPLELWVFCSEFQNGEELSGVSLPVLLDYPNELSFFNLEKFSHQIPRDGAFFADDVREIFSEIAQKKIFDRSAAGEIFIPLRRENSEMSGDFSVEN